MTMQLEHLRAELEKPLAQRHWVLFALTPVLYILSFIYFVIVELRMQIYRSKIRLPNLPVVSCGNLAAGGTGKSPLVRNLAIDFLQRGYAVCVLSRGYGTGPNSQGIYFEAAALEAEHQSAVLKTKRNKRNRIKRLAKEDLSDESLELLFFVRRHEAAGDVHWPRLVIAQYRHRKTVVDSLAEIFPKSFGSETQSVRAVSQTAGGCQELFEAHSSRKCLVLLDDGMQHTQCARHVDICVWSLESFLRAPRYCFPMGIYREGFGPFFRRAASRAQIHVWNRAQPELFEPGRIEFAQILGDKNLFPKSSHWLMGYKSIWAKQIQEKDGSSCELAVLVGDGRPQFAKHAEFCVVTGIGSPQRYVKHLQQSFAIESEKLRTHHFRDHEPYNQNIGSVFRSAQGQIFFLTLKDWLRWSVVPNFRTDTAGKEVYVCLIQAGLQPSQGVQDLSDLLVSMLVSIQNQPRVTAS